LLILFVLNGMGLQSLPIAAPAILTDWNIPRADLALPIAAVSSGAALGTLASGIIGDAVGRRWPIIGSALIFGVFMAAAGLATGPLQLANLLLLAGIGVGGCSSLSITLVTELAKPQLRSMAIGCAISAGLIGMGVASLVGGLLVPALGWHALFFLIGCALLVVCLPLCALLAESPSFDTKARRARRDAAGGRPPLSDVLRGDFSRVTPLLWFMFFLNIILGTSVLTWLPVILAEAGFPLSFAIGSLTAWIVGMAVGMPLAGWLVARFGVSRSIAIASVGMVMLTSCFATWQLDPSVPRWGIIVLLSIGGFLSAGMATGIYTISANAYPPALRARGMALADASGRLGGVAAPFISVALIDFTGTSGFFGALAGTGVVLTVCFIAMGSAMAALSAAGANPASQTQHPQPE
jgi:AAHS family 4-hydroxybenzoate transporter-like MFS transporter